MTRSGAPQSNQALPQLLRFDSQRKPRLSPPSKTRRLRKGLLRRRGERLQVLGQGGSGKALACVLNEGPEAGGKRNIWVESE